MENICNSKGEIISRTTVFPDTDDYELAKREFARIYAYTTRDKYKKYMLDKQYNKSKHNLASGLNETPTEEPETSKKVKVLTFSLFQEVLTLIKILTNIWRLPTTPISASLFQTQPRQE